MYSHTGTQRKTLNRVSTVCQEQKKKNSQKGKDSREKGNRWTLSCHAEEFICVFYLVEGEAVAQLLQQRRWLPQHLQGEFEWHWFCFGCEMDRESGDVLQKKIWSSLDCCGISQWWAPACPWRGPGRFHDFCSWWQMVLEIAGYSVQSEISHDQCFHSVL